MNIAEFIPTGHENAVTREQLVIRLNLTDREIRRLIEEARDRGELIINDGDGRGYYISDDIADIKKQFFMDKSRAKRIFKRLKTMRRILKDAGVDVR